MALYNELSNLHNTVGISLVYSLELYLQILLISPIKTVVHCLYSTYLGHNSGNVSLMGLPEPN